MMKTTVATLGTLAIVSAGFGLSLAAQAPAPTRPRAAAPKPALAVAHKQDTPPAAAQPDVVHQYCVGCHSDKGKAGGLSLVAFDASHADQQAYIAEKMIHKLRLGMMPPPGARRPAPEVLTSLGRRYHRVYRGGAISG